MGLGADLGLGKIWDKLGYGIGEVVGLARMWELGMWDWDMALGV